MGPLLNRVKANTSTTGTGAVTPGGAVVPYQSWGAAGAVAGASYSYLIEDGNAWELGTGVYNGTTITRPGPSTDASFGSSSGALLNLTGSATISCVANTLDFSGPRLLQTQTVSGVATVVFDNTLITDTFPVYKIRWRGVTQAVAGRLGLQLSPDNGTTWRATNYKTAFTNWQMDGNFSQYVQNGADIYMIMDNGTNTSSFIPDAGEIEIYYLRLASQKFSRAEAIGPKGPNYYDSRAGSLYNVAEVINAIRVIGQNGNISGTFSLYGVP